MRIARGGEILVFGKKADLVQYIDVRHLAEWMVRLMGRTPPAPCNVVGPAALQTLTQFIDGLQSLAAAGTTCTWIDDYEWLKKFRCASPRQAIRADSPKRFRG